jgi:putative peptide zinc metalloprotease protein
MPVSRVVVTLWVLATAAFILYAYGMMMLHLPQILGTAIQSLLSQIQKTAGAFSHGNALFGGFGALQVALLLLPLAGLALTLLNVVKRLLVAGWTRTAGRPLARSGFTFVTAAVALLIALAWWPHNNNYRPIQPTDTGTIQSSVQNVTLPAVIDQIVPKASPSVAPSASAAASTAPGAAASASAQTSPSANASPAASASSLATPAPSPSSSP